LIRIACNMINFSVNCPTDKAGDDVTSSGTIYLGM